MRSRRSGSAIPSYSIYVAIAFRQVFFPPLEAFDAVAPNGTVVGVTGEDGSGQSELMRLAAGLEMALSGSVASGRVRRLLGPSDPLNFAPVDVLLLDHALAQHDSLVRARSAASLNRLRLSGATILLVSHEEDLLRDLCDEVWWLAKGKLAGRGDPAEVLSAYREHIAQRIRAWGESVSNPMAPSVRRGDGRAEILKITTIGENGYPTTAWRSGENAVVRIDLKFHQAVADPVVGILIRTRVGMNVFGTNTELERMKFGPCAANDTLRLSFAFRCDLCPNQYTLTVASHDPDGVWHDWLEEAMAFSVTDLRSTAGVANLHARASVERI
jgi:energy-coupling factor transporter ATP-binding protein EcfA2